MKKSTFLMTLSACFIGVLGAIQVDRWWSHRAEPRVVDYREAAKPNVVPISNEFSVNAPAVDFRAAAKKVMPSVVSIDRFSRVRRGFFGGGPAVERESGTGSGVILSEQGVIVTNNHVVEGASRVRVRLSDKRNFEAKVLGTDPRSDIAVLKIEAPNLMPIEVGSSKSLEVGEWVLAVGNPLGFDNTVSVGVVSSVKRNLPVGDQGLVDGIQTDAAINPGNSGGALCNIRGELVGINTAIASGTGQSVGIGFAVPVDRVRKAVDDIVRFGYVKYAGIGISYTAEIQPGMLSNPFVRREIAEQLMGREDFPEYGLIIEAVSGPAKTAGLQPKDFLLEIDGEKVESGFDLNKVILRKKIGDKVTLKIWSNGQTKTVSLTLSELPKPV